MSDEKNSFTFHFHAPVGQQIAHVDKIEAHFDKDMNMQVMNPNQPSTQPIETEVVTEAVATDQKPNRKRKKPVVNTSFMTFQLNGITTGHITLLYQHLMDIKWITKDTSPDEFQQLFCGKVCVCKIRWIGGGIDNLYELFKQIKDQELITIPGNCGLEAVLSNHFVDKDDNSLVVQYSGHPSKKALPKILECIKKLQTQFRGDY